MTDFKLTKSVEQIWAKIRNPDFEQLRAKYPKIIGQYFKECVSKNSSSADILLTELTDGIPDAENQGKEKSQIESLFVFTRESNYVVTELLAQEYLGVKLELDRKYLCPRLGNRVAYITWIHALLDQQHHDHEFKPRNVRGLDIGTGATCVYPLVATALYENWHMLGTDLNQESVEHARAQLARNPVLAERINIKLCKQESDGFFFFAKPDSGACEDDSKWKNIDFVVCNPPFYDSPTELADVRGKKQGEASTELQAQDHELYTNGGEYSFVKALIDQSISHHRQKQLEHHHPHGGCWYTAMINKKSNLAKLIEHIRQEQGAHATNYVIHDLDTGSRTLRWVLGWNWGWRRAPYAASHSSTLKNVNPEPVQLIVPVTLLGDSTTATCANKDENAPNILDRLATKLEKELKQLDFVSLKSLPALLTVKSENKIFDASKAWLLTVKGDVWSRAYRRRQIKRQKTGDSSHESSADVVETILKITLLESSERGSSVRLQVDWVYGRDYKVLESFTTMVKRKLETTSTSD